MANILISADDFGGLNKLAADLDGASVKALGQARDVVRKVAADVERDGKLFCPVDTGNLRNTISSAVRGLSAEIGPTANYGHYVEWGTSRMAPQAFMGPALDRNTPSFVAAMEQLGGSIL